MKKILVLAAVSLHLNTFAQVEFHAFGADAAGIQSTVDSYRSAMGNLNPNQAGIQDPNGRREINWDAVPDSFSSPNDLPANFFNSNSKRGAVFSGASSFRVSADNDNPTGTPTLFSDVNASYSDLFRTFSPQRLFTSVGSNVYDVEFFVAGSNERGLTRGFGAVFTDVDLNNTTMIEYFDQNNTKIFTSSALGSGGFSMNQTLSFVGVQFAAPVVSRVRITQGNAILGANEVGGLDLVVADDFIYGEVVPEPASMTALLLGLAVTLRNRKKINKG